jgi:hypothetical protein
MKLLLHIQQLSSCAVVNTTELDAGPPPLEMLEAVGCLAGTRLTHIGLNTIMYAATWIPPAELATQQLLRL